MTIIDQARLDLAVTLTDTGPSGAGQAMVHTDPNGVATNVVGQITRITSKVDTDSMRDVVAPLIGVTLRLSDLPSVPTGIISPVSAPHLITISGQVYKVTTSTPDHVLGVVNLELEKHA